jgi:hypothetical protein
MGATEKPDFNILCAPLSFLPVNVQTDLFVLCIWNAHISLSRGNDDCFSRRRRSELLGKVYLDLQNISLNGHFHILHDLFSLIVNLWAGV